MQIGRSLAHHTRPLETLSRPAQIPNRIMFIFALNGKRRRERSESGGHQERIIGACCAGLVPIGNNLLGTKIQTSPICREKHVSDVGRLCAKQVEAACRMKCQFYYIRAYLIFNEHFLLAYWVCSPQKREMAF